MCALLLVIGVSLSPPGAAAHTGTYIVHAGNGLNLRTGPGGSYARIETMANGTHFKARGHRGNWMFGTSLTTGHTGWAWMSYLVKATTTAPPPASTGGYCMTNYWGEYVCASANVANAIRYWFGQYGVGSWWGFATASCESSFNVGAWAYSPPDNVYGLFQFRPSTFYPWGGTDLWDPWDQARIAAKMFASGAGGQFHCAVLQGW